MAPIFSKEAVGNFLVAERQSGIDGSGITFISFRACGIVEQQLARAQITGGTLVGDLGRRSLDLSDAPPLAILRHRHLALGGIQNRPADGLGLARPSLGIGTNAILESAIAFAIVTHWSTPRLRPQPQDRRTGSRLHGAPVRPTNAASAG